MGALPVELEFVGVRKAISFGWFVFGVFAVLWLAYRLMFFSMTGSFFPISNIEELKNPIGVLGWTKDGLQLADGRLARIPGVFDLPLESAALTEATQRGVEIADNGEMTVLVKLWHWCGNDPVQEDIRRIQLSPFLRFLRVGKTNHRPPLEAYLASTVGGSFKEYGWNNSEFVGYKHLIRLEASDPQGPYEDLESRRERNQLRYSLD